MRRNVVVGLVSVLLALAPAACGDDSTDDSGVRIDSGGVDSGGDDGGGVDSGGVDSGGVDSGGDDGGGVDSGGVDSGGVDSGMACGGGTTGECPAGSGLMCLCCPAGGPAQHCICSTNCMTGADCEDPARPTCDAPSPSMGGGMGICRDDSFACAWGAVCAAADTAIETPSGERAIASLAVGDLVYSVDDGAIVAVPIVQTTRTPVSGHHVIRVTLTDGRIVEMSPGHPTPEGRGFGDLRPGDLLGDAEVATAELVSYDGSATYDILPASDTGTYFAAGAQVGSTLAGR